MPCPHNEITIVQRSQRQSAVAAAAYQSGEKLFCEYDQQVKHYPEKRGIVHNEILLPANAPRSYADRNTLWNAAEAVEKQWNSQLARRWVLTIPREIPPDQYAVLVREFCEQQFVSKGMIADFAIHDPHPPGHNPHAHVMLTMRAMDEHGKWLPKSRKVYDLDENGERIKLPSGRWKSHKEDTVDWNDQKYCEIWRHEWEVIQNRFTGVVGEGTAEQLLPESYIYYNVDIQTADKKSFQAVVDDFNKELNIHELDTSYNIVYLNALGISYTANSEDANDKGFSFMTVAGILVGSLILLAAGLVIYNILKISVSKRIKGYGTLRAIGSEKGQLYQIIVIEVTLLCLIGIPIGMLLGFLSARGILETATGLVSPELFLVQDSSELKTLIAENSSLNGTLLILSGAITLAFALFAALPAARSAARVSPIMAMSGTNLKIRRRKRKTKKIHNFEAYYARLNLKRNKGRTAITILSLVMSITVFIALQGFSSLLNAASALQDNHLGDYQITNESVGFTADDLNTLKKNKAVQSVAAIQFSLYEQNENGQLDGISLEFQLKPGETFQVVGLNDEYWDYFMGDQLPEEQLGQLKSGNACIVRNPIPMSYGEDVLEFTNIEAGENICVAGMELNVLKTLDGYDGYLGIGNGGFTNGVQVIVDDAIYERLTGKDTYSEFLPTLNEGADRENFDTFIEAFCNRIPGTTFLSYEETDQQLKESFAQIQMLAWGLILFVGLIGILNIINTVYTNIHTRVTEIGMQRAIGMSADSLYKTFLWEGAYYGIIASVIGSVLGYVCTIFIEAATSDTIQLVAIPVMPILEATLLAVGACLLATAIPLRKISKMNIVDSIETVE